jgi:hypothetical protein
MPVAPSHAWFVSNQYSAAVACEYCQASPGHEPWCITQNLRVLEAWQPVLDPCKLSFQDRLILHALGVAWTADASYAQDVLVIRARRMPTP